MVEKPETTFSAGGVQASVFMNVRKVKGKDVEIPSVSFQKRYLKNGEWKSTNSLGINDLCKAILVLAKAYDYSISRRKEPESEDDDILEEDLSQSD